MKNIVEVTSSISFIFEAKELLGNTYVEVSFTCNGSFNVGSTVSLSELRTARRWFDMWKVENEGVLLLAMACDDDAEAQQRKHNYYIKMGFTVDAALNKMFRCGNRILVLDNR